RADGLFAGADLADHAEVEPGVDADPVEPGPGGVVAVRGRRAGSFGAAVDRLAVADRDREEEVGAFAAVEDVSAAVVGQGVVATEGGEEVGDRPGAVDQGVFAAAAGEVVGAVAAELEDADAVGDV